VRHPHILKANGAARGARAPDGLFAGVAFEVGPAAAPAR
jgi:hypothetical protein